ncbi:MAG: PKD domain-containing protein, partial [Thermoplasmata archaeon]|nr:PKD domain-containing protein [Thermoplasmata archaeon]
TNNVRISFPYFCKGVYLDNNSNKNEIIGNNVSCDNLYATAYGIFIKNSNGNLIYNNTFRNPINANDNGNNTWNDSVGNRWHDYKGVDTNNDGIGNTSLPYNCHSFIKNGGDWKPLTEPNWAPEANFTFSPTNPNVNEKVKFKDNSTDPDGNIEWRCWDFGDGVKKWNKKEVSHRFGKRGTYTVKLTVRDDKGATDTKIVKIQVGIGSWIWWVKPKENHVYLFDRFCFPLPLPGKILPNTIVIGPKITLTVGASEDVEWVKFYKWAVGDEFLMGSDYEPDDKHQFEFVFYPKHMFEYTIVAVGSNGKEIDIRFYAIPSLSDLIPHRR